MADDYNDYTWIFNNCKKWVLITINLATGMVGVLCIYHSSVWPNKHYLVNFFFYFGICQVACCILGFLTSALTFQNWMKRIYELGQWATFFTYILLLVILFTLFRFGSRIEKTEMKTKMELYHHNDRYKKIWEKSKRI